MDDMKALLIINNPVNADVTADTEAKELHILGKATQHNREMKLSEHYADMYHREHCARVHDAKRHQREMNNYLIFFLVLVASVIEILISVSGPAWVSAIPVIVTALIVRFLK